jgi:hypothetical protein
MLYSKLDLLDPMQTKFAFWLEKGCLASTRLVGLPGRWLVRESLPRQHAFGALPWTQVSARELSLKILRFWGKFGRNSQFNFAGKSIRERNPYTRYNSRDTRYEFCARELVLN